MVTCGGWVEPLNLQCLLVNNFAGTMDLFIIVSLIAIAIVGSSLRMINTSLLIIYAMYAIIMAQFMSGVYFLVILIVGLIAVFGIGRIAKN